MNEILDFDVVDDDATFFAPVASDLVDGLIGQYQAMHAKIVSVGDVINGPDLAGALHYFAAYAGSRDRHLDSSTVDRMFDVPGAVAHLNAAYWSKALHMTDVLDVMPQKRRDEWHAQMSNPQGKKRDRYSKDWEIEPLPAFEEATVRDTLAGLLAMRAQFLAERVDGIFRGLSGEHVTNAPEAFGKRMIIAYVLNEYSSVGYQRTGLINDLRAVIAKFMGRDEPKYNASHALIESLKSHWGEWVTIDGGALKIRLYKKGTAHMEIHPDMAWRLNQILAHLYPLAIPAEFRQKPKRKVKDFKLMARPLPFAVLEILGEGRKGRAHGNTVFLSTSTVAGSNKVAWAEAARVLEAIGGTHDGRGTFTFDYWPGEVLSEIIVSGCIPDHKSHQFYPTPESLARVAVELAEIGDDHTVLEPSAGTGGLANLLPKDRTTCVEISGLHCKVLEAIGHKVVWSDFLPWASGRASEGKAFDRVVMNPPFSEGRWQAHVDHAAAMVKDGGRLVAILPVSAKNRDLLPGWDVEWHGPYDNEFAGTSVSVVIMAANR